MLWIIDTARKGLLGSAAALLCLSGSHVSSCYGAVVAHYKFDEAAGASTVANSIAVNGGEGAVGANVVTGAPGKAGNAVSLNDSADQADIIDMGNVTGIFEAITTSGQLTISYWLSSTDVSGGRNVAVFLGDDTDNNAYIDSGIPGGTDPNAGAAQARNRDNRNSNIGELFGGPVNDGAFHHIVFSVDTTGATGALYVDGVRAASGEGTSYNSFPVLNNLEIGRLGRSAPTDAYEGLVDDLQIYDAALNIREVAALFGSPGSTLADLPPIVAGDTNGDGVVDVVDFNRIRDSLGYTGLPAGLGADIAGEDGVVDFRDLRFFQQAYPATFAIGMGYVVPEPTSLLPALLALGCLKSVLGRKPQEHTTS